MLEAADGNALTGADGAASDEGIVVVELAPTSDVLEGTEIRTNLAKAGAVAGSATEHQNQK
jgi:hypothetical protein